MKLLAIETRQYLTYYHSRYQQVEALGCELYALNGEGTPDFWPAERYRLVGTKQIDDMIAVARAWHREERFDGVITFSEAAVVAVAAIAEALELPGIGVEAARNSRNKLLMREAHASYGAPHPDFRFVQNAEQALAAAAQFGYPVILKPTMGAGSHFVFRVDTPAELSERFAQAADGIQELFWANSEADGIDLGPQGLLVESFLDGRELLIEALAWDDEVYLGSVVDRITREGATFDDDVHHAPTSLDEVDLAKVHGVVRAGAHAQGLRRSAMHAEVRFHRGEPYVLEIAARVGGGGLDEIARITAEYDPIAAVADVGRGVRPQVRHYEPTGVHVTAMCLICDGGVVERIDVPAEVSESEDVFLLKITARPGDRIRRPPEGNTIMGFLGTSGTSMESALATMNDFAGRIRATLVPTQQPIPSS
jgi:biotin carboxylase